LDNEKDIVLKLDSITKKYTSVTALDNVSITFSRGSVTSIYGPNGAGKSTLVKIICGEEKSDLGKIELRGNIVNFSNYPEALKAGVSYVPQDFGLLRNLSVSENIALANNQLNSKFKYSTSELENYISINKQIQFPLPELEAKIEDLSTYEQQIVAIHKTLSLNSDIIILDESTTNLNKQNFDDFKNVIDQLKVSGKTVIFISHKLDEVFEISDKIVILKEGVVLKECSVDKLSKNEVIQLFISKELSEKRISHEKRELLCELEIESNNLSRIQLSIGKGEVITIESDNTPLNQKIGYEIFDVLSNRIGLTVGIIPASRDEEALFSNLSLRDNLLINVRNKEDYQDKRLLEIRINRIAKDLRLKFGCWDQNINELSGGNKQKVIFGRWILNDFDLLILIEPTSGVDIETKEIIHRRIIDLKEKGKSFILISSDEGEQEMLQSRKIIVNQNTDRIC